MPSVRHRTAGMKVLRTLFLLSNICLELFLLLIRILKIVCTGGNQTACIGDSDSHKQFIIPLKSGQN